MNPLQQMQNKFLDLEPPTHPITTTIGMRKRSSQHEIQQDAKRRPITNLDQENTRPLTPPNHFAGPPLFNSTPNFNLPPTTSNHFFSPIPTFPPPAPLFFNDSFPFSMFGAPNVSQLPSCSFQSISDDSGLQSDASQLSANQQSLNATSEIDDDEEIKEESEAETQIVFDPPPLSRDRPIRDDDVFAEVSGRLCVLAQATKYKVSVGEIRRRISSPECLHASLINGILRKAKAKDGNKALRQDLYRVGLNLPSGRRKTTPATAFSALCEQEAIVLAQDFVNICENDFPTTVVAQDYIAAATTLPYGLMRAKQEFEAATFFLSRLNQVLCSVGVHPHEYSQMVPHPYDPVNPRVSAAINNFSLLTHGFGHNAFAGVVRTIIKIAKDGLQQIDAIQQSTNTNVEPSWSFPCPS